MKNYSVQQITRIMQLVSLVLVVCGFNPLDQESMSALVIVSGILLEGIAFVIGWIDRYKKGDITLAGMRKDDIA